MLVVRTARDRFLLSWRTPDAPASCCCMYWSLCAPGASASCCRMCPSLRLLRSIEADALSPPCPVPNLLSRWASRAAPPPSDRPGDGGAARNHKAIAATSRPAAPLEGLRLGRPIVYACTVSGDSGKGAEPRLGTSGERWDFPLSTAYNGPQQTKKQNFPFFPFTLFAIVLFVLICLLIYLPLYFVLICLLFIAIVFRTYLFTHLFAIVFCAYLFTHLFAIVFLLLICLLIYLPLYFVITLFTYIYSLPLYFVLICLLIYLPLISYLFVYSFI